MFKKDGANPVGIKLEHRFRMGAKRRLIVSYRENRELSDEAAAVTALFLGDLPPALPPFVVRTRSCTAEDLCVRGVQADGRVQHGATGYEFFQRGCVFVRGNSDRDQGAGRIGDTDKLRAQLQLVVEEDRRG